MGVMLSSWQFWAFLSAFFAAMTAILAKLGVRGIPPDVATFIRTIVILGFVTAILFATHQAGLVKTINRRSMVFLVLSGLATGASWLCYFRALDLGTASQVASIDKLSVAMVAVIGAVVLNETVGVTSALGIVLITAGTLVIASAK